MDAHSGKYEKRREGKYLLLIQGLSLFGIEVFAWCFLGRDSLWPLAFGGLWALVLTGLLTLLPGKWGRWGYGLAYSLMVIYAAVETGYYILFKQMMWLSDFRYASEGADYFDVLLDYPLLWWLGIGALAALGILAVRSWPKGRPGKWGKLLATALAISASLGALVLPQAVFVSDKGIQYAGSDYGRMQSSQAAYENMFNAHRLYQVCGLYQTLGKDIYAHAIFPLTPGYALAQAEGESQIEDYFTSREEPQENAMTGILAGKNVILVLMESMDDWMLGEHTPNLNRLMAEGISFTNFYTPVYGGIRTFNTEFAINTGSFLSSQGGYAFDYVTNHYNQSLASQLREEGYSAKTFHYNDPAFYSRGEFSPAMGYEEYVCYGDYLTGLSDKEREQLLYDDLLLFDNEGLKAEFFREGQPTLNFIITRSAHLSYVYNEVLSHWGLKKYPEYKGLTGNQETDCAYLKARLVDDLFGRMLQELEANGTLEDTVIIGVTDHYTYGYKDMDSLYALSGVEEALLLEKTPCFLWAADLTPMEVKKVANTSDLLPTVLNLLGVESEYDYLGRDLFDDRYAGFVPFSNGSWILGDAAYDAAGKKYFCVSGDQQLLTGQIQQEMAQQVQDFIRINNLILETDYYE